ncbi:MAG: hypothetical protein WBQ86_09680 [Candidatus Binatus sp.]
MPRKPKSRLKQAVTTDALGLTLQINNAEMLRRLMMSHECSSCQTCRTAVIGALTFAQLAINIAMQAKI